MRGNNCHHELDDHEDCSRLGHCSHAISTLNHLAAERANLGVPATHISMDDYGCGIILAEEPVTGPFHRVFLAQLLVAA